jgi:sugar O-acyltransferase (sialic acid O-acetyltransferase NeuD family)
MNRLVIIGAGGHGRVIADNALKNGYTDICFVDDNMTGECMGLPILGTSADVPKLDDGETDFIIGIGSNAIRKKIAEGYAVPWVTLIHPSAQIACNVSIGQGTVVMAGAILNVGATVGEHCIINSGAIIEHDDVLEKYVHISPGAKLGGTTRIGEECHVGIGATVINNVEICSNCTVGAGAVVIKNIMDRGTYVGVPVRKIK